MLKKFVASSVWASSMLLVTVASAAPVIFADSDIVATTSSAHPNSAIAAAGFDAAVTALGGGSLIDFESAPLGSFSNLTIAPGVMLNGTDINGANQTIRNTTNFSIAPTLDGFNTTSGGSQFVEIQAGTLTFSFFTPVDAFGAYFSGVQTAFFADTVNFSDGTSQSIAIPGNGSASNAGALAFVGFTDVGKSITSIIIDAGSALTGADYIGVDDVRFAVPAVTSAVPEPSTWAMMIAGFGLAGASMRRRRHHPVNLRHA